MFKVKIGKKGLMSVISMLAVIIMTTLSTISAFAADQTTGGNSVIDKVGGAINDPKTQEAAWGLAAGPLKILGVIILVLGIIVVGLSVIFLLIETQKTVRGKGPGIASADSLKRLALGLIIGLLVVGGGFTLILKAGNTIVVDPTVNFLGDTSKSGSGNATPTATPSK